jgi:hypothetical protein
MPVVTSHFPGPALLENHGTFQIVIRGSPHDVKLVSSSCGREKKAINDGLRFKGAVWRVD